MSNQHTDDSFMYTTDIPLDYFRGEYDEDNDDTPLDILGRPLPRVSMFSRPEQPRGFPHIHNPRGLEKFNDFLKNGYAPASDSLDSILGEISLFGQRQEEAEKVEDTNRKYNHDYFNYVISQFQKEVEKENPAPDHEYTRHVISPDLPSRAFVDSLLGEISSIGQYQEELEDEDDDDNDEDFGKTIDDIMPNYSFMRDSLNDEELSSLLKAKLFTEIKKYDFKDTGTYVNLENAQIYIDYLHAIQYNKGVC